MWTGPLLRVRRHPTHALAIAGLAEAQAELGQVDTARATLQALQQEPGDARALALQARLGR